MKFSEEKIKSRGGDNNHRWEMYAKEKYSTPCIFFFDIILFYFLIYENNPKDFANQ